MTSGAAYRALENRFRRISLLGDAAAVLHWDQAVMMPVGGKATRAEQLAELGAVSHGLLVAADTAELLASARVEVSSLDPWQQANLREMDRKWRHASALDEDLVRAVIRATSACEAAWRSARAESNFAAVLPQLETLLGLVRQVARAKGESLGVAPYDALLDEYEPDGRAAEIDPVFADLEAFLPEFLALVLEKQARRPAPVAPGGPFSIAAQRALAERLMAVVGFEFDHGRLDVSHHPFCGGVADDVRITTRYDELDFSRALMGVLHETGHALYERGLPALWRHQPVGGARSMSVHESQSLLVEMQACRSREFLSFVAPLLREAFGGLGPEWEGENLYRLQTRVAPGFIRVDADEVTYPAHVILRYRLESALVEGRMEAVDLPGAWADGMRRLLGLEPPDDRLGCLQDIHWYDGAWGYFPTYTLGAMTAAQLFATATAADAEISPGIGRGEFQPLVAWLRENVHGWGSRWSTSELLVRATGRPLDSASFKDHLRRRYLEENG